MDEALELRVPSRVSGIARLGGRLARSGKVLHSLLNKCMLIFYGGRLGSVEEQLVGRSTGARC